MDLIGKRFGRLVVTAQRRDAKNNIVWQYRCDCGNVGNVLGVHLRKKRQVSCGCYRIEINTTHGCTRGGKRTPGFLISKIRFLLMAVTYI